MTNEERHAITTAIAQKYADDMWAAKERVTAIRAPFEAKRIAAELPIRSAYNASVAELAEEFSAQMSYAQSELDDALSIARKRAWEGYPESAAQEYDEGKSAAWAEFNAANAALAAKEQPA